MEKADTSSKGPREEPAAAERAARRARAESLVKDHMLMSLGAGLIPAPLFDLVAGAGIQLALLKRLSDLYGVPFSESAARGILASVLGGIGGGALATGVFFSGVKLVPGAGTVLGVVSLPVGIAAITYALGTMFIAHLELGRILGDFRPATQRAYFRDLIQRGRRVASGLTAPATREPAKP